MTILAYNVCGMKSKKFNSGFFNYIKRYEIFLLFETFLVEEEFSFFVSLFDDYELKFIPAVRVSNYGRASEGFLFGIKKSIYNFNSVRYVNINGFFTINLCSCDNMSVYVLPVYLNCNRWEADFILLSNLITEYQDENFILLGDFNGRIGDLQNKLSSKQIENVEFMNVVRNSKDNVANKNGLSLIEFFDNYDFIVLNGRSRGDIFGEFSFLGPTGSSTIDLCCVSRECLPVVLDFKIDSQIYSDHMPIIVTCKFKRITSKSPPLHPAARQ